MATPDTAKIANPTAANRKALRFGTNRRLDRGGAAMPGFTLFRFRFTTMRGVSHAESMARAAARPCAGERTTLDPARAEPSAT